MLNFESFKNIYGLKDDISIEEMTSYFSKGEVKHFRKKEVLLEVGSRKNLIFVVVNGLLGKFKLMDSGENKIFDVYPENHVVFNFDMIFTGEPAKFSIEAMEDTTVLLGDFDYLADLIVSMNTSYPSLHDNLYHLYQKLFFEAHKKIEQFVFLSPKERYLNFIKENPDLTNRISDKHIAGLLGIHPVTFSRLKKQILYENK